MEFKPTRIDYAGAVLIITLSLAMIIVGETYDNEEYCNIPWVTTFMKTAGGFGIAVTGL